MGLFRRKKEVPAEAVPKIAEEVPEEIEEYKKRIEEIGSNIREDDLAAFMYKEIKKAQNQDSELFNQIKNKYGKLEEWPGELNEAIKNKGKELKTKTKLQSEKEEQVSQFRILPQGEQEKKYPPWQRKELELQAKADDLISQETSIEQDKDLTEEGREELLKEIEIAKAKFREQYQSLKKEGEKEKIREEKQKIEKLKEEIRGLTEEPSEEKEGEEK